jgi:uncharacterized protein (TIGR04222 family)
MMRLTDPVATALWSRLQAFELDPPGLTRTVSARIAEDNGWSAEHTRRAVEEYRRFLFLTQVAGHPVSPSPAVDVVWHTHLLYSQDYWDRLCGQVLGRLLHHQPNPGGEQDNARHHDQYRDTLDAYARVFGMPAPTDLWPRTPRVATPPLDTMAEHPGLLTRLLSGGYRPSLLAFLSGGDERVTATALAGLHQRGLVAFVSGRPVLGEPVPNAATGLTPEEWQVWRELRRLAYAGEPVVMPLPLTYPEVAREAVEEGLWPTPQAQARQVSDYRFAMWWSWRRWAALGVAGAVFHYWSGLLGAVWLLLLFGFSYSEYTRVPTQPTPRGQRLVEELARLVPRGAPVSLGSPLLGLVVAAGVIGASVAGDLASLQSAIVSGKSSGGGCGGGSSGGSDGGGDGGGGGGGDGGG